MTGFGKAVCEIQNKKLTIEARSLNSKQLDLNLRMPGKYRQKELELRADISKRVERGKVEITIFYELSEESKTSNINKPLVKRYYNELKSLADELQEENTDYLSLIFKMPDVYKAEKEEPDENEWEQIKSTLDKTLDELNKFRMDEGEILGKEFESRIQIIKKLLDAIEPLDAQRVTKLRERIKKDISEFVEKEKIDQNRFEQELIYYIERIDFTEEKTRLRAHCDYFLITLKEDSSGRKLGFISQEIGREINTLGSKANDSDIQKMVVQMKDELEKIKEQLLNVL